MSGRYRWAVGAAAVVAALIAAELLSGGSSNSLEAAPPLPDRVIQGPRLTIADLRGEPALIDFWASWCGPCNSEAGQIRRAAESLRGRGRVVAVDWDDGASAARAFVKRHGWRFPVLADSDGASGQRYGIEGLPTAFVVDPSGKIVDVLRGPHSERAFREAVLAAG